MPVFEVRYRYLVGAIGVIEGRVGIVIGGGGGGHSFNATVVLENAFDELGVGIKGAVLVIDYHVGVSEKAEVIVHGINDSWVTLKEREPPGGSLGDVDFISPLRAIGARIGIFKGADKFFVLGGKIEVGTHDLVLLCIYVLPLFLLLLWGRDGDGDGGVFFYDFFWMVKAIELYYLHPSGYHGCVTVTVRGERLEIFFRGFAECRGVEGGCRHEGDIIIQGGRDGGIGAKEVGCTAGSGEGIRSVSFFGGTGIDCTFPGWTGTNAKEVVCSTVHAVSARASFGICLGKDCRDGEAGCIESGCGKGVENIGKKEEGVGAGDRRGGIGGVVDVHVYRRSGGGGGANNRDREYLTVTGRGI